MYMRYIQVVTTAQEPKGQSCSTKGKLVGMVRRLQIETIRSQVLTCPEQDSMNAVQRLNGNGLIKQLKIESVPTEMWSSRGMILIGCYKYQESLKGSITPGVILREACSPIPTKRMFGCCIILCCIILKKVK
jgi:hypothetical protein